MRTILLDPSGSQCHNFGDLAMLHVAVARWRALWPSARIAVMTEAPEVLTATIPGVIPVEIRGRSIWLHSHVLGRLHRRLPGRTPARLEAHERRLKMKAARSLEAALSLKYRIAGQDASRVAHFLHWVRSADIVAVTGGGSIADPFPDKAAQMLDTLEMAATLRVRGGRPVTAIFGHGFGPLEGAALRAKARGILPRIDYIGLREARTSRALLHELGVHDEHIQVTGDEAIELAYDERQHTIGGALGVNIRIAPYANVDAPMLEVVRQAVQSATRRYAAAALPLPISTQLHGAEGQTEPDAVGISAVLDGVTDLFDEGCATDSAVAVIRAVGRCRLVVTGSYHAAVFALAQGIPAIGLVASPYYRAKFLGLAEQFEAGVWVLDMAEAGWGQHLTTAIDTAWHAAESVRARLLTAAQHQIELSRQGYRTVASMVDSRSGTAPATQV